MKKLTHFISLFLFLILKFFNSLKYVGFKATCKKAYRAMYTKKTFFKNYYQKSDPVVLFQNELSILKVLFFQKKFLFKKNSIYPAYKKSPPISIIAVNYNSIEDIIDFIDSINNQTYHNFELILVDNNSNDKSLSKFISKTRNKFYSTRIVENKNNVGFSEACNIGSRFAKNDLIALINIDTKLDKNWLKKLVSKISIQDVAAVTSKTLFFDDFITIKLSSEKNFTINETHLLKQFSYKKYFIHKGILKDNSLQSINSEIVLLIPRIKCLSINFFQNLNSIDVFYKNNNSNDFHLMESYFSNSNLVLNFPLRLFKPLINNAGSEINGNGDPYDIAYAQYDENKYSIPKTIGAFCGCSVLLDKRYFIERELFVGELFAYYEDSELSRYLIDNGYKIFYEPTSIVYHKHSTSLGERSLFREYLVKRNYYIYKNNNISLKYLKCLQAEYLKHIPQELKKTITSFDKNIVSRFNAHENIYKKFKNIGIYNTYWSTYGGGEKHALFTGKESTVYSKSDNFYLISESNFCKKTLEERFNIDLSKFKIIYFDYINSDLTKKFDVFINSTFLSNLVSKAKKSIYIVSFPQMFVTKKFLKSYIFLSNSWLSTLYISKYWGKIGVEKSVSFFPVFGITNLFGIDQKNKKVKNFVQIGRFQNNGGHLKRQDVTIKAFKKNKLINSRLVLIGSDNSSPSYRRNLLKLSEKSNIDFYFDAKFKIVSKHLSKSFFYISSAGSGEFEEENPEKLEHFGITILEAGLYGCIPIVYSQGGPAKIIESLGVGYKFTTLGELVDVINLLSSMDTSELVKISRKTVKSSRFFINQQIKNNRFVFKNLLR